MFTIQRMMVKSHRYVIMVSKWQYWEIISCKEIFCFVGCMVTQLSMSAFQLCCFWQLFLLTSLLPYPALNGRADYFNLCPSPWALMCQILLLQASSLKDIRCLLMKIERNFIVFFFNVWKYKKVFFFFHYSAEIFSWNFLLKVIL